MVPGDLIAAIVGTVLGGLILAMMLGGWSRREKLVEWMRRQNAEVEALEQRSASAKTEVLREQVLEVAREKGINLPASSTGVRPVAVTFSDGSTSFYFGDFATYQREMRARRVSPMRSFPGRSPVPVSLWDRQRLMQWLAENTEGPGNGAQ